MPVHYYTKKPLTIATLLWDGTNADEVRVFANGGEEEEYSFRKQDGGIQVWNSQEQCWLNVPVGHHVARGALNGLYPISCAALAWTFDPADGP
jgi:hypothetical protein